MHHLPEYIADLLRDKSITTNMGKFQGILDFILIYPQDKDYIYAWAGSILSGIDDEKVIIDYYVNYLPKVEETHYRANMQTYLIAAYDRSGQHDAANEVRLQRASESDRPGYDYKEIALSCNNRNDTENAIKYYEMYVEAEKKVCHSEDYAELAEIYNDARDFKNSAKYHKLAAQKASRDSDFHWMNMGRALALDGQEDEAMFYFKMSLEINPEDAWPHYYMGQTYQNKKDVYRAMHHYTEALKYEPNFAAIYNNFSAIAYNEDGNIALAIEHLEKALELDKEEQMQFLIYRNLANLYKKISDYDKEEYYSTKMMASLGFIYESMGENDDEDNDNEDIGV